MLYWDKDCTDFHVEEEVRPTPSSQPELSNCTLTMCQVFTLRDVFRDLFKFSVDTRALSRDQLPQLQAHHFLSEFALREDADNGLLIVYYAGHGGSKASELGHITLSGG